MDRDDALRRDMEDSRQRISGTVTEIEHRVRPTYVIARRRERVRRRLTDWRDSVFGNDEPEYPQGRYPRSQWYGPGSASHTGDPSGLQHTGDHDESLLDRGREQGARAAHAVGEAPTALRRQTRGNPVMAGALALGAGWLVGSMLPESRRERELAARAEPRLADAAAAAREEVTDAAHSVQDDARDAAERVKDAGKDAAHHVSDRGKDAASSVRSDG